MRLRLLPALLLLLGVGCGQEQTTAPPPAKTAAPAVTKTEEVPKTPVKGAKLVGQAFDDNGDGKPDRWRQRDPDGREVDAIDTDGDGVADTLRPVEVQKSPPPGLEIGDGGLKTLDKPPEKRDKNTHREGKE